MTAAPSGPHEVPVVVDPAPVAVRVELAHEQHARVVAMLAPAAEQWLEAALLDLRQVRAVEIGRVEQDIEIAHGPEAGRDLAQARAVAFRAAATERIPEDAPRGTLPARRHTHRVQLLVVLALACARLAGEHPGEMEAQDLAGCLRDVVVGGDPGRLDGRQAVGSPGCSACSSWSSSDVDGTGSMSGPIPSVAPFRLTAASADSSFEIVDGRRPASARSTPSSAVSRASSPLSSSTSSSANRSTTSPRTTTSTASRLSSTRVSPSRSSRRRRSWRTVTSSSRGASPASSSTSERASDTGQSCGPPIRRRGLRALRGDGRPSRRRGIRSATERLHANARALARAAQARREPGLREIAVGRIDVAVLDLPWSHGRCGDERGQRSASR